MKDTQPDLKKSAAWLDMQPEEFKSFAEKSIHWITEYFENMDEYPVLSKSIPGEIKAKLPSRPPQNPIKSDKIFSDFENIIIPGITHWNHPRFFAYFSVTGSSAGVIGEMLSAALNVNSMLWKTSPSATELEEVVLGWLRQMLDLPEEFEGVIHDTASVGVLCALAAARESAGLEIRKKGMAGRSDLPPLAIYISDQTHSSVEKGAIVLGIGQEYVRKIPSNDKFQMREDLLEQAIKDDLKNGIKPVCVVATLGTTSTTSIDPVKPIADICKQHNVWFHVDAAYGGPAAVLPEIRNLFTGWELADSIIVNPHKWLFTQIDCSVLYCRRMNVLKQAFSLVPEYLRTGEGEQVKNYMDYGIALGRRFRALKLWMVICSLGTEKIKHIIKGHINMARKLSALIEAHPDFELMAPVPFSTLVFCFNPHDINKELNQINEELLKRINASGKAFLSHTILGGKFGIRLAIGNIKSTWQDVKIVWDIVLEKSAELK